MTSYSGHRSRGDPIDLYLIQKYLTFPNGTFIEVGANDGITQSNTKLLEEKYGWNGILIEPSGQSFEKIKINRKCTHIYNCALTDFKYKYDIISGDFNGDLMSSIDGKRKDSKQLCTVQCRTLQSILDETHIRHVDFFSLDVEGYELNILNGIDFSKTSFSYILIEVYTSDLENIKCFLKTHGYEMVENISGYNKETNPGWDGTHNDYLFKRNLKDHMQFVTGERIQMLCDHYIATPDKFNVNPYFKDYQHKFINLWGTNEQIDNGKNIFCFGDLLPHLSNKLHLFKNQFNLVIGNSDENFSHKYLYLLDTPKLIKIITQNKNVENDLIIPLPIGLANSMWPHGRPELLKEEPKLKFLYFFFSLHTNPHKRHECFNILSQKGLVWGSQMEYKDYLSELGKHKYAICPDGNGIDTHRLWECIYLHVVPICLSSPLTRHFSKLCPMIVLNSWNDLNLCDLENKTWIWQDTPEIYMDFYKFLLN